MLLADVPDGNLIEFFLQKTGKIELGIKNKSHHAPILFTVTLLRYYYLLDPSINVFPVCDIKDFETGMNFTKNRSLKTEDGIILEKAGAGKVILIDSKITLKEAVLTTKYNCYGGVVVAAMGGTFMIPPNIQFKELGPCHEYNGLKDFKTSYRTCPNCSKFTLIDTQEETPGYNVVCECLNCKNKIAICWRKEI